LKSIRASQLKSQLPHLFTELEYDNDGSGCEVASLSQQSSALKLTNALGGRVDAEAQTRETVGGTTGLFGFP